MLSRKHRLTKQDFDFLEDLNKKAVSSANFTLKIYSPGFSPSRFAVVLSSKVFKKAVDRNKKKRQIKNIISRNADIFLDGLAFVIYPKKETKDKEINVLEKDLIGLFEKSGALKKQ